jgi:hypothetical protein
MRSLSCLVRNDYREVNEWPVESPILVYEVDASIDVL